MLPELQPVEEKRRAQPGRQRGDRRAPPRIEARRDPSAGGEGQQESQRGQDVRASDVEQRDQRRADERKDLGGDGVGVISVNREKRLDKDDTLADDRGQRKLERYPGVRNRVS